MRAEEYIFMYVEKSIPQEATQVPTNNTVKRNSIRNHDSFKPFHLNMYTLSESVTPRQNSLNIIQMEQGYHSNIYEEMQLLLVYNGYQKRITTILNKALIPC